MPVKEKVFRTFSLHFTLICDHNLCCAEENINVKILHWDRLYASIFCVHIVVL